MPKWNILNINAYNTRETGVNAIQEAAWALSLATEYIQRLLDRGLDIDDFAKRIGFFCAIGIDFLEEIAKIRAMRRIWARLLKERFGAKDPRSCWFRAAAQTAAVALTRQQPLNNIARTAIQTLTAALAGIQSLHTTSYDEAYALPSEESHKLSLRIQQIVAYETNITKTVDPLGGSYAIEWLTNKLEEEILAEMKRIEDKGGFIECYKQGWIDQQIEEARIAYGRRLESGEQPIVGVNIFREEEEKIKIETFSISPEAEERRIEYVRNYKKTRDRDRAEQGLSKLYQVASNPEKPNTFETIKEAFQAGATFGEIMDTLRKAEKFEILV
jgi:methylmalonyl-CoA mutase N-terminal domain/subunit